MQVQDIVPLYNDDSSLSKSELTLTVTADANGDKFSWNISSLESTHPTNPLDGKS